MRETKIDVSLAQLVLGNLLTKIVNIVYSTSASLNQLYLKNFDIFNKIILF